jgi:hypothetical protein
MVRREYKSFKSRITPNPCHPERSLAIREANRQTESKDPVPLRSATGDARSSLDVARFCGGAPLPDPVARPLKPCHPERSLAIREANRQTESKDPVLLRSATSDARSSLACGILLRIFRHA